MSKRDDDFGTTLPSVAIRPPVRSVMRMPNVPSVNIVARPAARTQLPNQATAIPLRPQTAAIQATRAFAPQPSLSYGTAVRPVAANATAMAVASPAGRAAAIKAAGLVSTTPYLSGGPAIPMSDAATVMAKSPADLAAAAFSPNTSGNPAGASANGYTGGMNDSSAADPGQSVDWSNQDAAWDPPAATAGTPSTALAIVPSTQTQAAIAPAKESFWSKLLALFGFRKKSAGTSIHGERHDLNSVPAMVASVVSRSRNGDQNAMALMALVRDNAAKGNAKAQETFALLTEYVRTHPVQSNPRIGYEPDYVGLTQAAGTKWAGDPTFSDAVALSHGPTLTDSRIDTMLSCFNGEQRAAIRYGIKNKDAYHPDPGVRMGRILGHARRLQAIRMKGSSMTKFDPRIGVEFGE